MGEHFLPKVNLRFCSVVYTSLCLLTSIIINVISDVSIPRVGLGRSGNRPSGSCYRVLGHAESKSGIHLVL